MEIELRLDADGRTTCEPNSCTAVSMPTSSSTGYIEGDDCRRKDNFKSIDYSTKAFFLPTISSMSKHAIEYSPVKSNDGNLPSLYDALLSDCEVVVHASDEIQKHTFWMALDDKPRCAFEQMALDIFHHHVPMNHIYDKRNSGSEWWVQIRPKTINENQNHTSTVNEGIQAVKDDEKITTKNGNHTIDDDMHSILFHWDKDEELRVLTGGALFVHPHLSTVTYLTDKVGAPTMILPCLADCTSGAPEFRCIDPSYFVSCPKVGKHISFDGRFLHAAPSQLLSTSAALEDMPLRMSASRRSPSTRITFLVNIWLNYRPLGVQSFPSSLLQRFRTTSSSSLGTLLESNLFHNYLQEKITHSDVTIEPKKAELTWILGATDDAEELIKVQVPLAAIQREVNYGGTLCVQWKDGFFEGIKHSLRDKS